VLHRISIEFIKLQEAELPFEKLKCLLTAVSIILEHTKDELSNTKDGRHLGCDDLLPVLMFVICKCGFKFVEIEMEFMCGLLQTSLMMSESGYYLTIFISAALEMKSFKTNTRMFESGEGFISVRMRDY